MNIQIISDIHFEHRTTRGRVFETFLTLCPTAFSGDVLVLPGDIATGPAMVHELIDQSPVPVVYVPGNHEYYGFDWDEASRKEYRDAVESTKNGIFLDRDVKQISDVCFIGATLWTNFKNGDPSVMNEVEAGINDFWRIEGCTPTKMLERFRGDSDFLRHGIIEGRANGLKTIAVTHFGPTLSSRHSRFPLDDFGYYFVSDLSPMIIETAPTLWVHGHTHDSCDYEVGTTRVVSRQLGYPGENRGVVPLEITI